MVTLPLLARSYRVLWDHKWLAARKIVVGWAVMLTSVFLFARRFADLDFWLYAIG